MNIFKTFLFLFLSIQVNAAEDIKNFFETNNVKGCNAFFLVKKPNMMQKNMLVIFTSKSKKYPPTILERVIDCTIFNDNIAVVATQKGDLHFINFANNADNSKLIFNSGRNIKAISAINGDKPSLVLITDNELMIMPRGQETVSNPKILETQLSQSDNYRVKPCSTRYLASQNIIFSSCESPIDGIFVIKDFNNKEANIGHSDIKDLCYDKAGNQFEINNDKFGADWKTPCNAAIRQAFSCIKPIQFVEQDPLDFGMEILANFEDSNLMIILQLVKIDENNALLHESAYFHDFDEIHQSKKNIKRVIKFAGNFIIFDEDKISIWGNELSEKVELVDGYHILDMLVND
jgi:hypothetical protein